MGFFEIAVSVIILLLVGILYLLFKIVYVQRSSSEGEIPIQRSYFSSLSIFDGKQLLFSLKGKLNIMALSLTNSQQAAGVLTFKDKKLAITDVPDGQCSVTSSDTNVFTTSYEDATNTVTVVAQNAGVAALSIMATNKANQPIPFEDIAIEVTTGDAQSGGVEFGTPTEQ